MTDEKPTQIFIMGKAYDVPPGVTIMDAMEYAGYRFVRGAGCRSGFCGACGTVYRKEGDYRFEFALACQEMVQDGMHLTQLPFTPAPRAAYELPSLDSSENVLLQYYPEIARCVSCNTCTKACPQDLEVMEYVQAALRGDLAEVAALSFDCIQCGLCAMRCPADIKHYHMAQLARRLLSVSASPVPEHLTERLKAMASGACGEELDELVGLDVDALKERYSAREIEPAAEGAA
ncbi:MAG: 4Fe-4S dicluster domain-containing protein [Candidatus Bipolaricaulota bacterium]|nr:MAG: 4Fe-4S dicluster domain-containing protein [Candidatus Bipolaricaulota bacterium]